MAPRWWQFLFVAEVVASSAIVSTEQLDEHAEGVVLIFESASYSKAVAANLTDVTLEVKPCGDLGACDALSKSQLERVVAVVGSPKNVSSISPSEMPNLRLLQSSSYMYTSLEDVPSPVTVASYQPDWRNVYGVEPIAEWVIAAAFEWNYRLRERHLEFSACAWGLDAPSRCPPVTAMTSHPTLMSRTMGVLGYGEIGQAVARRSAALGMRTIATKKHGPFSPPPPPLAWLGDDNDRLLRESDFVAVTVPGSLLGVINRTALSLMKPGAVLIPVSAPPVDFDALCDVLLRHSIGGAVLDVWPEGCWKFPNMHCGPPYGESAEPYSRGAIQSLDNVLLLPGMAMRDDLFWAGSVAWVADNLRALVAGAPLRGVVRNGTSIANGVHEERLTEFTSISV